MTGPGGLGTGVELIAARLNAATPGPWAVHEEPNPWKEGGPAVDERVERYIGTERHHPQLKGPEPVVTWSSSHLTQRSPWLHIEAADADLIAHAPADLAFLLAQNAALEAECARLRGKIEEVRALQRIEPFVDQGNDDVPYVAEENDPTGAYFTAADVLAILDRA